MTSHTGYDVAAALLVWILLAAAVAWVCLQP